MIDHLIEMIETAGDAHEGWTYRNMSKKTKRQAARRKTGLVKMLMRLYRLQQG